jgi:hypothetical protein
MAAGNVSFWSSHSGSGHSLSTTQERYWDREDVFCSLAAAKCLEGWDDFYGRVRFLCAILLLSSSFTIKANTMFCSYSHCIGVAP